MRVKQKEQEELERVINEKEEIQKKEKLKRIW